MMQNRVIFLLYFAAFAFEIVPAKIRMQYHAGQKVFLASQKDAP